MGNVVLDENETRVFFIVDPNYGDQAANDAKTGPIWIIRSDVNYRAVRELWAKSAHHSDHVTIFDAPSGASLEEVCMAELPTIDEHHPAWTSLQIRGVTASHRLRQALAGFGSGRVEETADGLIYHRAHPFADSKA